MTDTFAISLGRELTTEEQFLVSVAESLHDLQGTIRGIAVCVLMQGEDGAATAYCNMDCIDKELAAVHIRHDATKDLIDANYHELLPNDLDDEDEWEGDEEDG